MIPQDRPTRPVTATLLSLALTAAALTTAAPTAAAPAPPPPVTAPARLDAVALVPAPAVPPDAVWPLQPRPRVVARFAPPAVGWASGHRGVDLEGFTGQPVQAALGGVVAHAGVLAGRGVVSVEHADGTRTTYQPLLVGVRRGDVVRAGDRLGWLVATGSHCAPAACLHWGRKRGEEYLDPLALVGATPVRLLPWSSPPVVRR